MNGNKGSNRCNRSNILSGSNVSNTPKGSTSSSSSINFGQLPPAISAPTAAIGPTGNREATPPKARVERQVRQEEASKLKRETQRQPEHKEHAVCCFLFPVTLKWTHGSRVVWLLNTPAGASVQEEFKRVVWRFPSSPWGEQPLPEPAGGCRLALKSSRISSHTLRFFFIYYSCWNFRVNLRIFHCSFEQNACDYQSPTDQ